MERVYWIEYKGKQILFSDYSNLDSKSLVEMATFASEELFEKYKYMPLASILSLADVHGSVASKDAVWALKNVVQKWKPLYKKQAVIGMTAFNQIFLNAINKSVGSDIVPFGSKDAALEWLVDNKESNR
jgi:hypothetical protein